MVIIDVQLRPPWRPFLLEVRMTMFQRKHIRNIKKEMDRQHAVAEAGTDSLLDKLRASKWTGALLLATIVIVTVVLWGLF